MQGELGRFFEGRLREVTDMMLVLHDYCVGQGKEVKVTLEGTEMVFRTKDDGFGFLRVLPMEVTVMVSFPRGHEIPDPKERTKGPVNSRKKMIARTTADIDLYIRRMIDAAYAIEG